jgi:hypothetical protein
VIQMDMVCRSLENLHYTSILITRNILWGLIGLRIKILRGDKKLDEVNEKISSDSQQSIV